MVTIVSIPPESEEYGMLIPLSAVLEAGELRIHAIREAEPAAQWLDSLAPLAAIDAAVRDRLDEMLRPVAASMGYEPEEGYIRQVGYIYRAERAEAIHRHWIRPDTVRYVREEEDRFLTETVLDEESDACTIFATVQDHAVLSFANLNSDDGEVADIGVETALDYEGQGFAASNVAALTLDLLEKGRERVVYVALSDNPGSIRVAEKVGLVRAAVEYNYVCFRQDEGD